VLTLRNFADVITFTRAGSKTGVLSSGLIGTFGTGVPAFVHDPVSLARRGLSVEGSRTNSALRSEDWTVSPWAAFSANVSNSTISGGNPSGGASALLIVPDAGAGDKFVGQELTSQDLSVARVLSVFLKAGGLTTFGVRLRNNAQTIGIQANFDLVAGTATASNFGGPTSAITPIIEAYPNGWWRCTVGGALSGTTETLRIRIGQSATHDGTSGVYGWGAQLEPGSRPTSYIPTEATAVTRAADSAVADATGWVAAGQGTLIAVGRRLRGAANARLVELNDGTSDQRLTVIQTSTGNVRVDASGFGGGVSTGNLGVQPEGAPLAMAVAYQVGQPLRVSVSGGAATSGSSGAASIVPDFTRLRIGRAIGNTDFWDGTISRVLYYPTPLSDAEIQAITAALAAGG